MNEMAPQTGTGKTTGYATGMAAPYRFHESVKPQIKDDARVWEPLDIGEADPWLYLIHSSAR